jgi:putative transcriptional regulator
MTLSKILNQKGYNTTTDKLDKLAEYFDCEIGDLVERVREETTDE